jgi:hypothetical protein
MTIFFKITKKEPNMSDTGCHRVTPATKVPIYTPTPPLLYLVRGLAARLVRDLS